MPVSMLLNSLLADSRTQVTNVQVSLAACRGWNVTATVEGRVVAVRHCRDWHLVEHVCSQLRNEGTVCSTRRVMWSAIHAAAS